MNNRDIEKWKKTNKLEAKLLDNSFEMNVKRYNELMENFDPNNLFESDNDDANELKMLNDIIFGKKR